MTEIGESFNGETPARQPTPGMGLAVARRTVFRESDEEDWGRVADRVAEGNISCLKLLDNPPSPSAEEQKLRNAIACGALLTSGRHLQHGDAEQFSRDMAVFTNCSTSATTYGLTYLLLAGSGVGRSYDDDMIVVDWARAPALWFILSRQHPDYPHTIEARRQFYQDCTGLYNDDKTVEDFLSRFVHSDLPDGEPPEGGALYHQIADSREGWAKAVEIVEAAAFEGNEKLIELNFSQIRQQGSPVQGMQGRPCAGPISWLRAFVKLQLRVIEPAQRGEMELWEQAMWADHVFAEEVLVGDIRRAARMSTKSWRDPGIFKFIKIKNGGSVLWTSNNSVMGDGEYWDGAKSLTPSRMNLHAKRVFGLSTENSFIGGEPGTVNGHKLEDRVRGSDRQIPVFFQGEGFGSSRYKTLEARRLLAVLASRAANTKFPTICNPCGEIPLHVMGGFCVIADVAPLLACPVELEQTDQFELWDRRVEDSIRLGVRFLIRVNLMDSVYNKEVLRTNRIGISLTGIHEWAWLRWGLDFHDLLDEKKSYKFWATIMRLSSLAKQEAQEYSGELGIETPTTVTTIKPSGTISKLFNLTEGAHLPARRQYLRWVQFRADNPMITEYQEKGYPVRELKTFPGMSIVGFPTMLLIQALGMGDRMTTASEATPEEQYRWLRLLERHWLGEARGAQISYTLKIDTSKHSLDQYRKIVLDNQPNVKCCSILPHNPDRESEYEYLPEEAVSALEWQRIQHQITVSENEGLDLETLRCEGGVCPI